MQTKVNQYKTQTKKCYCKLKDVFKLLRWHNFYPNMKLECLSSNLFSVLCKKFGVTPLLVGILYIAESTAHQNINLHKIIIQVRSCKPML